jgi:hypothetical protein
MNDHPKDISFIFPGSFDPNTFAQLQAEEPFSENAIAFLDALAGFLRSDRRSTAFPELITFAFFCRRSNVMQLKKEYYPQTNCRMGAGVVFHITPSNMAMNFAYSLVSGILSGNLNIVRLPSKKFAQADIVCQAIQTLSSKLEFQTFAQRILLLRYEKESSATAYFSSICNARIIWGGDHTIEEIKKKGLTPKARDISFGDKYSICVINADNFIADSSPEKIAQAFYNDTFLFDQNACTSPHLIVWLGSNKNILNAKNVFWNNLHDLVKAHYDLQAHSAIDKLTAFYTQAMHMEGIKNVAMPDNRIWRIELNALTEDLDEHRCNCGYFIEYTAASLLDLTPLISKKYQTIGHYGIEKENWDVFSSQTKLNVQERLRPIGKTSEFSLTWDGCNLIDALSRAF